MFRQRVFLYLDSSNRNLKVYSLHPYVLEVVVIVNRDKENVEISNVSDKIPSTPIR